MPVAAQWGGFSSHFARTGIRLRGRHRNFEADGGFGAREVGQLLHDLGESQVAVQDGARVPAGTLAEHASTCTCNWSLLFLRSLPKHFRIASQLPDAGALPLMWSWQSVVPTFRMSHADMHVAFRSEKA